MEAPSSRWGLFLDLAAATEHPMLCLLRIGPSPPVWSSPSYLSAPATDVGIEQSSASADVIKRDGGNDTTSAKRDDSGFGGEDGTHWTVRAGKRHARKRRELRGCKA